MPPVVEALGKTSRGEHHPTHRRRRACTIGVVPAPGTRGAQRSGRGDGDPDSVDRRTLGPGSCERGGGTLVLDADRGERRAGDGWLVDGPRAPDIEAMSEQAMLSWLSRRLI